MLTVTAESVLHDPPELCKIRSQINQNLIVIFLGLFVKHQHKTSWIIIDKYGLHLNSAFLYSDASKYNSGQLKESPKYEIECNKNLNCDI